MHLKLKQDEGLKESDRVHAGTCRLLQRCQAKVEVAALQEALQRLLDEHNQAWLDIRSYIVEGSGKKPGQM